MTSVRNQTPDDNSRIQQLKLFMRDLALSNKPFVSYSPSEDGSHFMVKVGRSKIDKSGSKKSSGGAERRTVNMTIWQDGSRYFANADFPQWAKDVVPEKDSNRIYVFKHSGGKMGSQDSEGQSGSFIGVRLRIQDKDEFTNLVSKLVTSTIDVLRGKSSEGEGSEEKEEMAAMKSEAAFPIVGIPINEEVYYEDASTFPFNFHGTGKGEYLVTKTSGSADKAVVELFGPIPTHDRYGNEVKIESLHIHENWKPIIKVNADNRNEAVSQAAQYFADSGFETEQTYGTLHIHAPGVLSESFLRKNNALISEVGGKGITIYGKELERIDNDFYKISPSDAKKACGGKLPGPGKEKLCTIDDQSYFVSQTPVRGEQLWSIRTTNWKPDSGGMKLGESRYCAPINEGKGFEKGQTPFLKARSTGDYGEGEHFVIDLHDEHGRAVPLGGAFKKRDREGTYYEDDSNGLRYKNMKEFKTHYLKRAKSGKEGKTTKTSADMIKESFIGEATGEQIKQVDFLWKDLWAALIPAMREGKKDPGPGFRSDERIFHLYAKDPTAANYMMTMKGLKKLVREAEAIKNPPKNLQKAMKKAKEFIAIHGEDNDFRSIDEGYSKGMDDPDRFVNHYKCDDCDEVWDDVSPYKNNDRCPKCDNEIEPYQSDDISEDDVNESNSDGGRSPSEIAQEIKKYWPKPHYAAQPYLDAMMELNSVDDEILHDSGYDIINRFIGNASTWRGPDAKRIKAELKKMINRK